MRCKPALALFVATLLVYAYFFQGGGFNQNAQFDTVRALVERRSFEISPYTVDILSVGFTGDVSQVGDRVYSSKPPGLALVCAPFYALIYGIERALGIDVAARHVVLANQWLTTIWGAALPGALLAVAVFRALCRRALADGDALFLASGFAFGSLLFPYAGMLTLHSLVTLCLFVAWLLIDDSARPPRGLAAGGLIGLAVLADISAAPLVPVYAMAIFLRRRAGVLPFIVGPVLAAIAILIYQRALFGGALELSTSRVQSQYTDKNLFLQHLHWPDLRRLWWLSFHPLRGLFYCCPIFILALLSIRRARPTKDWLIPTAVIANFVLFNLTFHAWTAGWGTGPRYLIPILPFLLILGVHAYQRFRTISYVVIILSVVAMLAVTSVRVQWPAKLHEPPFGDDPVPESIKRLTMRQVARDKDSSNLGLVIGLPRLWSILPPATIITAMFVYAIRLRRAPTKDPPHE